MKKHNNTLLTRETIKMAKVIKFNITVDGVSIRTIEELIEHFNISDIAELYESGTLLRWLQAREYLDYAEKIQQIDTEVPLEQKVTALCSAFGFSAGDIEQAVSAFLHTKRRDAALKEYAQDAASVDKIITSYLADYEKLKTDLKAHSTDETFIQTAVEQLASMYQPILQYDGNKFYAELKNVRQSYSLITKQLRLNQTTRAYLYLTNSFGQIFSPTAFSMLIESMMEEYPNDLIALKRAADQIAQNYMPEFEQQWERLFNEIKGDYPLIFCALCMNHKINTFICKDRTVWHEKYNASLQITNAIFQQCSSYLKKITRENRTPCFITAPQKRILIISVDNAIIRDISEQKFNTCDRKTPFMLFNNWEYYVYKGGGEILYMEVPETDTTVQA